MLSHRTSNASVPAGAEMTVTTGASDRRGFGLWAVGSDEAIRVTAAMNETRKLTLNIQPPSLSLVHAEIEMVHIFFRAQ